MRSPSPRLLASSAVALLVGPIVYDLLTHDRKRIFTYLATDAYYYLTVAWNFAHLGSLSYDQRHASNGYHPLWQAIQCLLFLFRLPDTAMLYVVTFVEVGLLAGAFLLLARAMVRDGKLTPLFTLLPLGVFGLIMAPYYRHLIDPNPTFIMPLYGSTWLQVDGMESSLTTFSFALAAFLYVRGPEAHPVRYGLALAALTLARLDHGFFAAGLYAAMVLRPTGASPLRDRAARRTALHAAAAFAGPVLLYLAVNKVVFGNFLPLSGVLKSTFPHPLRINWFRLRDSIVDFSITPWRMYRLAQIVLPLVVTPLILRRGRDRFDDVLLFATPGVLFLGFYDFWFVDLPAHGHWYFPVSTLYMSLVVMRALPDRGGWFVALPSAAVCLWAFFAVNVRLDYNSVYANFYYEHAPKIRAFYGDKRPGIVELDDGIIAFSTHFPCMSGSGLHLDPQGFAAYRNHGLYPLAVARGYNRIATVAYGGDHKLSADSSNNAVWSAFSAVVAGRDLMQYRFKVEFVTGPIAVARGERVR